MAKIESHLPSYTLRQEFFPLHGCALQKKCGKELSCEMRGCERMAQKLVISMCKRLSDKTEQKNLINLFTEKDFSWTFDSNFNF